MLAWQMLSSDCLKHLLYQKRRRLADPRSEHLNLLLNVCKAAPVLEAHLQIETSQQTALKLICMESSSSRFSEGFVSKPHACNHVQPIGPKLYLQPVVLVFRAWHGTTGPKSQSPHIPSA